LFVRPACENGQDFLLFKVFKRRINMASKISSTATKLVFALGIALFSAQTMAAGALAIDSNQGGAYGWAEGYANTNQAEQRALRECGGGCQIVLTYNNGCGAYAADQAGGSSASGWGTASSDGAAQSRALSECQSRGGRSCVVRAWSCN
jgi:hypothetical protein